MLKYILLFSLGVSVSCDAQQAQNQLDFLLGSWTPRDSIGLDFYLDLSLENTTIIGQYCSMTYNASRIDCWMEDGSSPCAFQIDELKNWDNFEFEFINCRGGKRAKAKMSRSQDYLIWELIKIEGRYMWDHLIPSRVVLEKDIDSE